MTLIPEGVIVKTALRPFSKGINTKLSPIHLPDQFCQSCQNIRIDGISTRPALGYDQYGDAKTGGTNTKGGAYYEELDGTDNFIMNYDSKLYRYNPTTNVWDVIAAATTPITTDTQMNFLQAGDSLLCMNGVDELGKLDGTAYTEPAEATIKPLFAVYFAGRMWAAGVSTKEDVLYYGQPNSDPINNPEYFYTIGGTANGAGARGLSAPVKWAETVTNTMLVATSDAIWTLNRFDFQTIGGFEVPNFKMLQRGIGGNGAYGRTVAVAEGSIYYLGRDNQIIRIAYADFQEPTPVIISDDIEPTIESLDPNQDDSFVIYYPKERLVKFWVKTEGATFNDLVLVWDLETKSWLFDTEQPFNWGVYGNNTLLHGSAFEGRVFRGENGGAFDGDSTITTQRRTKDFVGSGASREDMFSYIRIVGELENSGTNLGVKVIVDDKTVKEDTISGTDLSFSTPPAFGTGVPYGGSIAFGGVSAIPGEFFERIIIFNEVGKKMAVEFETSQTAAGYRLHELDYGYLPMGTGFDNPNNIS